MKKKILLIAAVFAVVATIATASDGTPTGGERGTLSSSQQVIVTGYYNHSGYEFASRISRFHTSYTTFDFYSPMYTETYWYRYTPYTWGVSIYDDWHYYGAGATRYAWRNGFGGSYWWGYDPWRNYDPWMGYGWNSWNSPGVSYSVNYYLGRPHYHYPVAYNSWNSHHYRNYNRSVTVINNNTYNYYYGSEKRNSQQGSSSGYNPTNPGSSGRRTGYTSTGGRSSTSGTTPASPAGGRTEAGARDRAQTGSQGRTPTGTQGRTQTGTRSTSQTRSQSKSQTGNQGNTQTDTRTGTRSTSQTRSQSNSQTGNQANTPTGTQTGTRRTETTQTSADRAPAGGTQPNKVQSTVRTTTRRGETVMRQGSPTGTTTPKKSTVRQSEENNSQKASEGAKPAKESKKSTTPAQKRR